MPYHIETVDLESHFPDIKRVGYFVYETAIQDSENVNAGFRGGCVIRKSDYAVFDATDSLNKASKPFVIADTLDQACEFAYTRAEEKRRKLIVRAAEKEAALEVLVGSVAE